jgi:hypothetical protein
MENHGILREQEIGWWWNHQMYAYSRSNACYLGTIKTPPQVGYRLTIEPKYREQDRTIDISNPSHSSGPCDTVAFALSSCIRDTVRLLQMQTKVVFTLEGIVNDSLGWQLVDATCITWCTWYIFRKQSCLKWQYIWRAARALLSLGTHYPISE